MKYLQWVGLVPSLLFVGVLGGLLAPLSSEAQPPTITVAIDGVQVAPVAATETTPAVPSILKAGNSTCTAHDAQVGYTHYYGIRTSTTTTYAGANGRLWTIQDRLNSTARLRIADWAGYDLFSLVGVQIVPVPWANATAEQNTNEVHKIKITMTNQFNSPVNVNNAAFIATDGGFIWALRIAGEFRGGPAGDSCHFVSSTQDSLCDPVGDCVEYIGTGIFTGTARVDILSPPGFTYNTQPLSFTVAGPHDAPNSFFDGFSNQNMGQVQPYPRFDCSKQGAETTCQQDITQIMTVTLKGQDTFILVGGGDGNGARCQISEADQLVLNRDIRILTKMVNLLNQWEDQHPNATQRASINNLQLVLDAATQPPSDLGCPGSTLVKVAQAIEQASDQVAFIQDGAVPAEPVPQGTGTIKIIKRTSPNTMGLTFGFTGIGNGITNFDIVTNEDVCSGDGCWGAQRSSTASSLARPAARGPLRKPVFRMVGTHAPYPALTRFLLTRLEIHGGILASIIEVPLPCSIWRQATLSPAPLTAKMEASRFEE